MKKNSSFGILTYTFVFIVGVGSILFFKILPNWEYWFPNATRWRMDCTFPEVKGHIQTVGDYKICLSKHNVTPTDKDIRKMCYYYSRDEYYLQTNQYPNDTEQLENAFYKACLHEEGLSE